MSTGRARRGQRAHKHTQTASIRIAAPPEKVWDQITKVAGIADWYDNWDQVVPAADDERLQVGTSFRLIRHHIGSDDIALCRVTSSHAPTRLGWVQHASGRPAMLVEFELLHEGAAGTLLDHTRTWIEPRHW
jgi:uncharacterized protein YndB with AHSA1/START domain